MNIAGYIARVPGGDIGTRGSAYTYIMAGNGLWLEAENPLLEARIQLASLPVRGLPLLKPRLELRHGKVPGQLAARALSAMSASSDREMYAAITWDGEYRLVLPPQERGETHVTYEVPPGHVVGIHSHGRMGAYFSTLDNLDDQGFQVEVVVGKLDRLAPAVRWTGFEPIAEVQLPIRIIIVRRKEYS
ncbi:hypothetical protein LCGC14_2232520 [marine sediment metagenome]|uniref:JAB domain-containing protein n=1 Tax=marine sediment metagenome TaxID=412755 RepID=A0A0F9D7K1_9ZZZZ